jgi:hypothetical protein
VAAKDQKGSQYTMLPGSPHACVAVPLDYPPAALLQSRYGSSAAPLPGIERACLARLPLFRQTLRTFSQLSVPDIRLAYDVDNWLAPAWCGHPISPVDIMALWGLLATERPRLYVEIGTGTGMRYVGPAVRHYGLDTHVRFINASPNSPLESLADEVVRGDLGTVDLSALDDLGPGDMVFFDGTHRAFMNSDVTTFMLDVLPHLPPGVLVQMHDITLPSDYPQSFADWYWNEQYMLAAWLLGLGDRMDLVLPLAWLGTMDEPCRAFANMPVGLHEVGADWSGGGSFWFRTPSAS